MFKKLKVQGNKSTNWVTLPNMFSRALGIAKGDTVKVEIKANKIIITKEEK